MQTVGSGLHIQTLTIHSVFRCARFVLDRNQKQKTTGEEAAELSLRDSSQRVEGWRETRITCEIKKHRVLLPVLSRLENMILVSIEINVK